MRSTSSSMFGAVSPRFSAALETRGVTSSMRAAYSPSSKSSFVFLASLGSYFNMGYSFLHFDEFVADSQFYIFRQIQNHIALLISRPLSARLADIQLL